MNKQSYLLGPQAIDGAISYLEEPPTSVVALPVHTRIQELPFEELSWQDFERLCLRLVRLEQNVEHVQPYGVHGEKQDGIDIYARPAGGGRYSTYQCKKVVNFGAAKIASAVQAFLNGDWAAKSARFVLCTSESMSPAACADEIERQSALLRSSDITFIVWDRRVLSDLLRQQAGIVDDFFGYSWMRAFCGEEVAARLNAQDATHKVKPEKAQAALAAYRTRLARELELVSYRGIAGTGIEGRVVELPMSDVYVHPLLLTERHQARFSERERDLLSQLSDPDVNDETRALLEVEHARLAAERWKAAPLESFRNWNNQGWLSWVQSRTAQQYFSWEPLTIEDALSGSSQCVVLGPPGSGKSTLSRWLAWRCAQSSGGASDMHIHWPAVQQDTEGIATSEDRVSVEMPILVSLAAFAEALETTSGLSLHEFLKQHLNSFNGADLVGADLVAAFERCFSAGTCWIILDGMDEIGRSEERTTIVKRIESFLQSCGDNRCLITSRPHGYNRITGRVTHFYLEHFVPQQVALFVVNWHIALNKWQNPGDPHPEKAVEEANQLLQEIQDNPNVAALVTNPLLLIIAALIHRERKHLPERRVELYDAIVSTLIETWNNWRSSARYNTGGASLSLQQMRRVLGKIALWARREKPTGVMPRGELKRQLTSALESLGQIDNDVESTVDSYLNAAVEQAGLLEERVPGVFAFWHPTFEEFLSAREIATPTAKAVERILPLRHDPRWREVILLAVGCIGVLHDDSETATELVRAIADAEPDATEPLIHRHLRLAAACLRDNPHLNRALAQNILTRLAQVVSHQPFEPMSDDFRDTANALARLVPDDGLVAALEEMSAVSLTRGEPRTAAFQLLANAAATNEHAENLCHQGLQLPKSEPIQSLRRDAMARFYAAIGMARAGEINTSVLVFLVACNQGIEHITNVVELLDLSSESNNISPTKRRRRFALIREVLHGNDANTLQTLDPHEQNSEEAPCITGRLCAALILLFARETSSDIWEVVQEALRPEHDDNGAVFDAAQVALIFEGSDTDEVLANQTAAIQALRRWLTHAVPERRVHTAKVLLTFVEGWEEQSRKNPAPDWFLIERNAKDEFEAVYKHDRNELRSECFACLVSCLHVSNLDTRLIAADALIDRNHLDPVMQAITLWTQDKESETPAFFAQSLIVRLAEYNKQGQDFVLSWLRGEDDWMRTLACGAFMGNPRYQAEALEGKIRCLSSPHDEVRSAMAGSLAMLAYIEKKSLAPEVEQALRSCLGSSYGDASRNAAAALYWFEERDENVISHLSEYLFTEKIGERFDTLNAYRDMGLEQDVVEQFLEALEKNDEPTRRACDHVRDGVPLTNEDAEQFLKLVRHHPDEDHTRYAYRRFFVDWLCWNLEAK